MVQYIALDIESTTSTTAIVAWEYNGTYFVSVVTMSGTDLTYGASLTVQSASGVAWTTLVNLDATRIAMVRWNGGNMYGAILTRSGTDVTVGPTKTIVSGDVTVHVHAYGAVGLSSDKFVAICMKNGLASADRGPYATVCGVSGTDITTGPEVEFESTGIGYFAAAKLTADSLVIDRAPSSTRILHVSGLTGTFGGVGAHPITMDPTGLVTETLDATTVVIAHSEHTGSPWPIEMAVGIIGMEASMTAPTPGAYPSIIGDTRVVAAMWAKNLTDGSSAVTVERGYQIDMTATTVSLGGTTAVWSDAGISTLMSTMNDGSEHLLVLDFESTGGTNWNLRTSVDGAGFTDQGAQDSGTQVVATADTAPNLSIADGASGQWVDELVMWSGDKAAFDRFTTEELANLNDLADTFGEAMDKYEENYGAPICWQATARMPDGTVWRDSGSGPCPAVVRVPRGAADVVVTDEGRPVSPRIQEG